MGARLYGVAMPNIMCFTSPCDQASNSQSEVEYKEPGVFQSTRIAEPIVLISERERVKSLCHSLDWQGRMSQGNYTKAMTPRASRKAVFFISSQDTYSLLSGNLWLGASAFTSSSNIELTARARAELV